MTFDTLTLILRNDILAESSTDYFSDAELLDFVKRAANELSGALGFPIKNGSASISVGDSSFTIAADAAVEHVNNVSLGGFSLRFMPYGLVKQYQSFGDVGNPRYYYFSAEKDSTTVEFAPAAVSAGTMVYEYQKEYDASGLLGSQQAWDGLFPRFHEVIAYRAGVKAFDASLEVDMADRWMQKHDRLLREFAVHLGKSDVAEAMMMGANRES